MVKIVVERNHEAGFFQVNDMNSPEGWVSVFKEVMEFAGVEKGLIEMLFGDWDEPCDLMEDI